MFDFQSVQNKYSKADENHAKFEKNLKVEQARVIFEILTKSDTLSLMPTSFGKTLCIVAPSQIEVKVKYGMMVVEIYIQFLAA
jgi:superfamily II DNA helicase RecQ